MSKLCLSGIPKLCLFLVAVACVSMTSCNPKDAPQNSVTPTTGATRSVQARSNKFRTLSTSPEQDGMIKVVTWTLPAPSAAYLATTVTALDNVNGVSTNTLIVTNTTQVVASLVMTQPMLLPANQFVPQTWSNDGQRVYISELGGAGWCSAGEVAYAIYQVDVASHAVSKLNLPSTGSGFSVAPNGKHIAYFESGRLVLLNVETQMTQTLTSDISPIANAAGRGSIRWNETSDAFAFLTAFEPCNSPDAYQVFTYSISDGLIKVFSSQGEYDVEGLERDGRIVLRDRDNAFWAFDPQSKTLMPAQ